MVALVANAGAQTANWMVPSSGYIYDSIGRSIRPVTGLIGAAFVGPSLASGIDWLCVSPNQKSALAENGGSLVWIPDLSAPGKSRILDRVPLAQQAFWAADSSQAVLLTAGGQLVWLASFSSGPVTLSSWNLESASRGGSNNSIGGEIVRTPSRRDQTGWSLLAADSSANQVLLVSRTAQNVRIWLASTTTPPMSIPFSGQPVAAAFSAIRGGVFIADAASHQIVLLRNPETSTALTTIVSSEVYVNDPSAMVLASDGNRLFVADRTDSVIRVFDVSGANGGTISLAPIAELQTDPLPGSLTGFAPDLFLLNAGKDGLRSGGQPLYFLDTRIPAKISFVPRGQ